MPQQDILRLFYFIFDYLLYCQNKFTVRFKKFCSDINKIHFKIITD